MKDFEELTEDKQNEVIMNIGAKLTRQEIWYWEGLVHKLREYEKYFDSDEEIKERLVDRIKRQEKEIERLNNIINELEKEINKRITNIKKYGASFGITIPIEVSNEIDNKLDELNYCLRTLKKLKGDSNGSI